MSNPFRDVIRHCMPQSLNPYAAIATHSKVSATTHTEPAMPELDIDAIEYVAESSNSMVLLRYVSTLIAEVRRLRIEESLSIATINALTKHTVEQARLVETILEKLAPRWIAVNERLPEIGVKVLIFTDRLNTHTASFRDGEFYDVDDSFFLSVTHWQPLPDPPKESV